MFRILRKKQAGFTLVEVIVVAVIVAVLALVAIQLYQGYVTESRRNTAENLAASAASFLQTIVNSNSQAVADALPNLTGGAAPANAWVVPLTAGGAQTATFTCPANAIVTKGGGPAVTATVGGVVSTGIYNYR
jgi:type IV pilus assembly protein PilA